MDLELTSDQRAVADLARQIFADAPMHTDVAAVRQHLAHSGLDDLFRRADPESRLLTALVVEQLGAAVLECNVTGLVAGVVLGGEPVIAVLPWDARWARFPSDLNAVAVRTEDKVRVHHVGGVGGVQRRWGDPYGQIVLAGPIPGEYPELVAWYRCLSAAEAIGAAGAALDLTWRYVGQREQFGARLVDRQVVRHRLAEIEMELNAARLLAYEGAWLAPDPYAAVLIAAAVTAMSRGLVMTLHRLTGAIGLTHEYPLARLTGRVRSISRELGAPGQLFREVARERRAITTSSEEATSRAAGNAPR